MSSFYFNLDSWCQVKWFQSILTPGIPKKVFVLDLAPVANPGIGKNQYPRTIFSL
jgi:hypothetical protein